MAPSNSGPTGHWNHTSRLVELSEVRYIVEKALELELASGSDAAWHSAVHDRLLSLAFRSVMPLDHYNVYVKQRKVCQSPCTNTLSTEQQHGHVPSLIVEIRPTKLSQVWLTTLSMSAWILQKRWLLIAFFYLFRQKLEHYLHLYTAQPHRSLSQ